MKHSHMVKSKKSTKLLHPIVQPGDCVVSGLLYNVQPGDCVVCGHLYSLVIVL